MVLFFSRVVDAGGSTCRTDGTEVDYLSSEAAE